MWLEYVAVAIAVVLLVVLTVVPQIMLRRFAGKARAKGRINRYDLRKLLIGMGLVGLGAGVWLAAVWVLAQARSPQGISFASGVLLFTLCPGAFAGIFLWVAYLASVKLKARLKDKPERKNCSNRESREFGG